MSTQMDDKSRERMTAAAQIPVDERSLADNLRIGGGAALVLILALFFALNFESQTIDFLVFDVEMPLVFALLASAVLGGIATWLFTTLRGRSERKRQEALFDSAMRGANAKK